MSCSKLYFLFVEILLLVLPHSVNELVVALSKITCLTKEKVCHAQNCIFFVLKFFLLLVPHSDNDLAAAPSKITCLRKEKVFQAQNCIF